MKKIHLMFWIILLFMLLPVFPAQALQIPSIEFNPIDFPQELTPEQACQIERISGKLTHRLSCMFISPYTFISFFVISSILGGILLLIAISFTRRFGHPKKHKKLIFAILFLLPFLLLIFL